MHSTHEYIRIRHNYIQTQLRRIQLHSMFNYYSTYKITETKILMCSAWWNKPFYQPLHIPQTNRFFIKAWYCRCETSESACYLMRNALKHFSMLILFLILSSCSQAVKPSELWCVLDWSLPPSLTVRLTAPSVQMTHPLPDIFNPPFLHSALMKKMNETPAVPIISGSQACELKAMMPMRSRASALSATDTDGHVRLYTADSHVKQLKKDEDNLK